MGKIENLSTLLHALEGHGADHDVVAVLTNLGHAHASVGDGKRQVEFLERALAIKGMLNGPEHLEVATLLTHLGHAYGARGDAEKMLELVERALKIIERHFGPGLKSKSSACATVLFCFLFLMGLQDGGSAPRQSKSRDQRQTV